MSSRVPIVVVGSANRDMVITVPHVPRPGETILGRDFTMVPGGKGANQAVAAARAGGSVAFVGRVGSDAFGDMALAELAAEGVETTFVFRDRDQASGVALISVAEDGENAIAVAPGANAFLGPEDVVAAEDRIASSRVLVVQLEIPLDAVRQAVSLGRSHGVTVILNPAPARRLDDASLAGVSIVTPNETEAEVLTGVAVNTLDDLGEAARRLLATGPSAVIITLGRRGAFLATAASAQLIPGYRVDPVDTTAAGDVFTGVLAVAVAEGRRLQDAVRFAHAAAALSTTRRGAQPSAPTRGEILDFQAKNGVPGGHS